MMRIAGLTLVLIATSLLISCGGLDTNDDFLLWRPCEGVEYETCDRGQVCLPHTWDEDGPGEFRCRDAQSLRPSAAGGTSPPAYCDDDVYVCPSPAVCQAEALVTPPSFRRQTCGFTPIDEGTSP